MSFLQGFDSAFVDRSESRLVDKAIKYGASDETTVELYSRLIWLELKKKENKHGVDLNK